MIERILARMPDQLDLMLAAAAVVQDYWVQLYGQMKMGIRRDSFQITIEIGDESHLFLTPVFPKMEVIFREQDQIKRRDWDCVLDMRDMASALRLAVATKRHVSDVWGIQFGATAKKVPELGGLMRRANQGGVDVLIDSAVEGAEELARYMDWNYPGTVTEVCKIDGRRVSLTFTGLSRTRVYVGYRGGASCLGSSMGKAIIECYPNDLPLYFLCKEAGTNYKAIYGESFPVEILWNALEQMWLELQGKGEIEDYTPTPQQEMTING